jgi:hypothetical protein
VTPFRGPDKGRPATFLAQASWRGQSENKGPFSAFVPERPYVTKRHAHTRSLPVAKPYMQPVNLKELRRVCQLKLPLLGMYSLAYQKVQSSLGSMEILV